MNAFLLSFDANTSFSGGNSPTLEILVGGVVVSYVSMLPGATSYDIFIEYNGSFPSSLDFRFAGSSGDPGDTISFTDVSINNSALNLGSDLTATILAQAQSTAVTAGNDLFGHTPPTPGAPTLTGTAGNDTNDANVGGTNAADIIDGLAGDDRLRGRGDDDIISGGEGDDVIFGEAGNDTVLGGIGNDILFGNEGDDVLYGEAGDDYLIGGAGNDLLNGGGNNDGLIGGEGNDVMFGEDGDDFLSGDAGDDILFGDNGADTLVGGAGNDALSGGEGDDQLIGGEGNDLLAGGDGADEIIADAGDDIASGGAGNDTIYGGDGNDELSGGNDSDSILGGGGDDLLNGDDGNDVLIGGSGADTINGGNDTDILQGHGLDAYAISSILFSNPNIVYSESTGSFYQYVTTASTWSTANTTAMATTLNGVSGHLAVITSAAENTFLESQLNVGESAWLAGSGSGVGASWTWNAGSEAGMEFSLGSTASNNMFTAWLAGEPNDGSGSTVYAHLREGTSDWTDSSDADTYHYFIEWESSSMSDDNAADILDGGAGNDQIYGYGGDDTLSGGDHNDLIFGGDGIDTINGDNGADTLDGDDGNDIIDGGAGDDILYGGNGDDALDGGADNDTLYGDSADINTVLEAGRTSVTQTGSTEWHTVNFTGTIDNAVVKMFGEDVNGDPFTIRVRDISATGFEFQLDEFDYQDGITASESISWIAVSSGSHTLSNGTQIQAGFATATNETATSVSLTDTSYSSPIVFSQVSSDNELSAVVTRNSNVTSSGFTLTMQEEEANANTHATEDIGWIAIETGGSVASGILAGSTGDVVTHGTTNVNFGGAFAAAPIFVADMQTLDGADTGVTAGASSVTTTQAQVFVDEEESGDGETTHTTENVGYVALNEGTYTSVSFTNGSDTLRGGDGADTLYADGFVDTTVSAPSASNPLENLILNDSPVAYWNLNETSGTTVDNLGSEGSAVDGTTTGGPTLGVSALYAGGGTAVDFDGTNDGILIPDSVEINTGTYTAKTVELVFNADDVTTRQALYEEGGGTHGFSIYLDGGNVYVTGEHDGQWIDANINASVSTGTTYHVAFVFDQPNNSFEGFLDGVSMGSVTVNNATFPAHSGDIGIGYSPDGLQFHDGEGGGGFYFDGRISDVGIYTTALTDAQIDAHSDIVQGIFPAAGAVDDILYGGDGLDQLYGGDGRDLFMFEAASAFNDVDQINSFDVGENDAIDLSDILTGYTAGSSDINDFVTITTSGSNSIIAVDANGAAGGASFTDIAQINDFAGISVEALLANNSLIPV